jgi:NAD+ kinase
MRSIYSIIFAGVSFGKFCTSIQNKVTMEGKEKTKEQNLSPTAETQATEDNSNGEHLILKRKSSSWGPLKGEMKNWPKVNIYLCKRPFDDDVLVKGFDTILTFLLYHKEIEYHVYMEETVKNHSVAVAHHNSPRLHFFQDRIMNSFDINYVFTLGGDGTILWAHKMFNTLSLPPFLCFNGGTLCFLSNFDIKNAETTLSFFHTKVKSKSTFNYKIFPRLNSFVCGPDSCERYKKYMLNDVVVERTTPNIIALDIYINDCLAVSVKSDGLLISSSTGSTAYNLSLANGVIMHSDVESIIINPMASMSLSSRPIIVPKNYKVKVVFSEKSRNDSRLVYDGVNSCSFSKGDSLTIESCSEGLSMILKDDHNETASWIHKLRELRGWK